MDTTNRYSKLLVLALVFIVFVFSLYLYAFAGSRTPKPSEGIHKKGNVTVADLSDCMITTRRIPSINKEPLKDGANLCKAFTGTTRTDCTYRHPNIVYYVKFTDPSKNLELHFRDYVSIFSVDRFYQPDKIVIYSNKATITGKYWEMAKKLSTPIEVEHTDRITSIGKKHTKPGFITHEADYLKVSRGLKQGGIYSDFDVVVLNGTKLREMQRKSELVLGRDNDPCSTTCAGFFSCVPGSKLMEKWLDSYENDYKRSQWIYNAGWAPSKLLRTCPSCYDVTVDSHMSNWDESDRWGQEGKIDWRSKAVAHYMNKGIMTRAKEPKVLFNMSIPFSEMVKYVLGDTWKDL